MLDGQMIQIQIFISATHHCVADIFNDELRKWVAELAVAGGITSVIGSCGCLKCKKVRVSPNT
jgi:hypothetical protein